VEENRSKIKVSPKMSEKFLATMNGEVNRPYRRVHAERLAYAMANDLWEYNGASLKFDKKGVMMDGQHRCGASIISGKSFITDIVYGLCSEAFHTIDVNIKVRGASDIFHIWGEMNCAVLAAATKWLWSFRERIITASGHSHGRLCQPTPKQLHDLLDEFPGLRDSLYYATKVKFICPKSSAMFLHFVLSQEDCEDANKFFDGLAIGAKMAVNNPILVLRNFLMDDRARVKGRMPNSHRVATMIKGWNLWRQGKKITSARPLAWRPSSGEKFPYDLI